MRRVLLVVAAVWAVVVAWHILETTQPGWQRRAIDGDLA